MVTQTPKFPDLHYLVGTCDCATDVYSAWGQNKLDQQFLCLMSLWNAIIRFGSYEFFVTLLQYIYIVADINSHIYRQCAID